MKKGEKMKRRFLAWILCMSLLTGCYVPIQGVGGAKAYAAEIPVYDTNIAEPSDGCVLVGIEGQYVAYMQEALDRINEIRREACKEGVQVPGNPKANLTESDYVPIKWSYDLECIARIRAAEAIVRVGHTRPNGEVCFSLKSPNGVSSYGEILAWNYTEDLLQGIEQWYGEKADWVGQTGKVTGHYTQMIDPKNTYIGLGCFLSDKGQWPNCTSGEFSSSETMDENKVEMEGMCIQKMEVLKSALGTAQIAGNISLQAGQKSALSMIVPYTEGKSKLKVMSGITWQSDSPSIVSVDQDGVVTAIADGKATVTAISEDGFQASATVAVAGSDQPQVSESPTMKPTVKPTVIPTVKPTMKPTATPTGKPTAIPTAKPTMRPTATPTVKPTAIPTVKPTMKPTATPTVKPTAIPTAKPTMRPTATPTGKPTAIPTAKPTMRPTATPTVKPTAIPTAKPTIKPTVMPTVKPMASPSSPAATKTPAPSKIKAPSKPGRAKIVSVRKMKKGVVKLRIKKISKADFYYVQYSTKKNFKQKQTTKEYSTSVKLRLKRKKTYYIRVRAARYGNKATDYQYVNGPWSKIKKVKTKK